MNTGSPLAHIGSHEKLLMADQLASAMTAVVLRIPREQKLPNLYMFDKSRTTTNASAAQLYHTRLTFA